MYMSDVLEFRKGSGFNDELNLHPCSPAVVSLVRSGWFKTINPVTDLCFIVHHGTPWATR